jgi:phosphoglycerate dehydrogenase-like enzyme
MKVLLPDSIDIDETELHRALLERASLEGDSLDDIEFAVYSVDAPIPSAHSDAQALVVWGNPADQLRDAAARLAKLRWVQTLAAGPDSILAADFAPEVVLTAGGGLHNQTVTEHALSLVLAAARRLNLLIRAQVGHRWAGELGGIQPVHEVDSFRTLRGARVLIWGFGGIAATLAPHLAALGARVTGVARSGGQRHGFPVVTVDDLPGVLPDTDVLIMILPATPDTRHVLDAQVLAGLPAHAWVVNVGRGTTVDQDAVLDAVRAGRLGGAALDVFDTEPLPPSSGLWDEPNIIITPHAAGGRPIGAASLIADNLIALRLGRPLQHVVAREPDN